MKLYSQTLALVSISRAGYTDLSNSPLYGKSKLAVACAPVFQSVGIEIIKRQQRRRHWEENRIVGSPTFSNRSRGQSRIETNAIIGECGVHSPVGYV